MDPYGTIILYDCNSLRFKSGTDLVLQLLIVLVGQTTLIKKA